MLEQDVCVLYLSSIRISIVCFDRNARSGSIGKDRANSGGSCNPALDKFIRRYTGEEECLKIQSICLP